MSDDVPSPVPIDLRRRAAVPTAAAIEIGGPAVGRRVLGPATKWAGVLAVAAVTVVAFRQLAASWRVALVVVAAMAAYMLVVGRMVEGRADRID